MPAILRSCAIIPSYADDSASSFFLIVTRKGISLLGLTHPRSSAKGTSPNTCLPQPPKNGTIWMQQNSNSKTLFYKDCSQKLVDQLVLAKPLMNRYQITGIIYQYTYTGMNERVGRQSEELGGVVCVQVSKIGLKWRVIAMAITRKPPSLSVSTGTRASQGL